MWEGDHRSLAGVGAHSAARASARAPSNLHVAGGHARHRSAPVRAEAIALERGASADLAFAALLGTYAPAIAENLRCVLTEHDPEGPHQLRVTLRRLRTALRVFRPVIRRTSAKRLAWVGRYIGAIVGELRDADVIIEEMFRPALEHDPPALSASEAWREDVRRKVRASLNAARATAFASDLQQLSKSGEWRVRAKRSGARRTGSADVLISAALDAFQARAVVRGARMASLAAVERHSLRKHLKTLRYTAELAGSYNEGAAAMASLLKRLQTVLGELNDMHLLETVEPAVCREHGALAALRNRLIEQHAQAAPALVESATARWRHLSSSGRFRMAATRGL